MTSTKSIKKLEYCACCGDSWRNRKEQSFETGVKSTPVLVGVTILLYNNKKITVKIMFCDLHFRIFDHFTRYLDNKLEIKNINTNRWRKIPLGVAV